MGSSSNPRLLAVFLQELQERSEDLERDLLATEKSGDANERSAAIRSLLRAAHSLKGAAALVGMADIEMICHKMEDVFISARDGLLVPDSALVQLLLRATDYLREAGRAAGLGQASRTGLFEDIRAELAGAIGQVSPPADAIPATPLVEVAAAEAAGAGAAPGRSSGGVAAVLEVEAVARVPAAKLDALHKQSGELLVARSRAMLRINQLARLQELVRSRRQGRDASPEFSPRSRGAAPPATAPERAAARYGHDGERRRDESGVLAAVGRQLQQLAADLARDRRAIEQAANALELEVRGARLQPFASACVGLDRLVRDLALASGKEADLEITGGEIEIDRSLAEALRDILAHLVRNALDHGLEPPHERNAASKPGRGRITIAAAIAGDRISVCIADDGRGLDPVKIREQARASPEAGSDDDPLRQIFVPGFSTSSSVTRTSGRGVGLDIVKTSVERMRGAVAVSSRLGQGTTFTLTMPTTLGTIRALMVKVGEQIFAIDTSSVDRLVRVSADEIRHADERMFVLTGSAPVPALDLREWLGLSAARSVQAGYRMSGGRVLRPARVSVAEPGSPAES